MCIYIYIYHLKIKHQNITLLAICEQVGGDTWSTYLRPSGLHLPFYVQTWVDIFSFSGAELTGQCHSQFEMDIINICGIF